MFTASFERSRLFLPILHRRVGYALLTLALAAAVGSPALSGQDGEKRPLPIADYKLWRSISGSGISADGAWVGWTYGRVRGDDTLHVSHLESDRTHVVPLGSGPRFSDDSRWVAYWISPPFEEAERNRRDGEPARRKVGLMNLSTGKSWTWEDGSSFGFNKGSTHFMVKKEKPEGGGRGSGGDDDTGDGTDLILRNLGGGYDELIGSVAEAEFNKPGSFLAYTVDATDRDGNGLYLLDLGTGARRSLDNAKARYSDLAWSEEGGGVAALRGNKPEGKTERENVLVAATDLGSASPRVALFEPTPETGLPEGAVLSEKASVSWSQDLRTVFVGFKSQEEELEDWPEGGLPLADVNIWHWADDRIQTAQIRQASRDRNRTFLAAVHMDEGRMVPLADNEMRTVELARGGPWGIGRDGTAYVSDWKPATADFYRVDIRTGERIRILEAHQRTYGFSPDGKHYLYWREGDFWAYRPDDDRHINLTASSSVDFTNAEFDRFGDKPPYGIAGWAKGGDGLLLNHRYDIWFQPLDGSAATNLTQGRGANEEIQFRYVQTDPDERFVDLEQPLLLSAFGQWTKKAGFFELAEGDLEELTYEDRRFGRPQKAENADRYLFTVQSWTEFPDLWVTRRDFEDRDRITEANPQQEEYLWGSRILFDYTNADGVPLQGTLAIPEGYEEGQRLPMIVRFYEKYSQDLHAYPTPIYRHQPNFAGTVSNGYLLMMPDIHFRIGSSHSDMLECIEAAVRKVVEMGYADPDAIGLSGHSYSGGGGAYVATRSDMFAAVAHGAAPINLISEFNQLFVGSGANNHSYDIYGQGRYGTNPYDDFQLYWDQSPISGVETMDTPVLYLHGEADPTVNWEQGLEWYNALRFLGKPIIWLSYPDEGHGLSKLENRIDFQYRLRQFFDHHLKGAPAPKWMTDGVSQLEKEKHLREFAPKVFVQPDTTSGGDGKGGV